MATRLTTECQEGQNSDLGAKNPYLFSSDAWLAFQAGQKVWAMSRVQQAHKGRGYSVVIHTTGGNIVDVKFTGARLDNVTVDRR